MRKIANILSIAGSDPSGGAGIQADIKSISANGGYAMAVITALTVQNTQGVHAAQLLTPDFVAAQISAIFADIRVDAVKIGMLGNADIALAVAAALHGCGCPVVLDPVMVAKGGDRLLATQAVAVLRDQILPVADIITPNIPEAADLLGCDEAKTRHDMETQAEALLASGANAVLLKGGHLSGASSPDLLLTAENALWLETPRVDTTNCHGTGCTLSAALATYLGQMYTLTDAVHAAKFYVHTALRSAHSLSVGDGHGPLQHFWEWHDLPRQG